MGQSELHRFGIDPSRYPDRRQWENVCKLLTAILTNPSLDVGDGQSQIRFPHSPRIESAPLAKGQIPPFSPVKKVLDEGVFTVTLTPGLLVERYPVAAAEAVITHMPVVVDGATKYPLDGVPAPELSVTAGNYVVLVYQTDDHGAVRPADEEGVIVCPRIEVVSDLDGGTHYQPCDPGQEEGTEGYYQVPLFRLSVDGEDHTVVTLYQQSDVEHTPELWTGVNLGSGNEVYKERNETADTYQFRTITDAGEINISTTVSDEIEVRGNSTDGSLGWRDDGETDVDGSISWSDGLNTDAGGTIDLPVVEAAEGSHITVTRNPGTRTYVVGDTMPGPNTSGLDYDIILYDCDTDPSAIPVTGDWADPELDWITVILRMSFEDGLLVAVNNSIYKDGVNPRELAETRTFKGVQSCHWCDDLEENRTVE
jgi:hypothetical protein